MSSLDSRYWAPRSVEITADVEVECLACDRITEIKGAELFGDRDDVFLNWVCICLHQNYDFFSTDQFKDEG